jgi:amidohydrolase
MRHALDDAERELLTRESGLISLRRHLHHQPELAFAEHGTAALVASRLEGHGLEVRRGVAETGVVAILRGARPGRSVAWRADLDALPIDEPQTSPFSSRVSGVMHACGHDGHTALAVILAEVLSAFQASLEGTIVFLFQPAEELLRGAQRMLAEGVLEAPHVEAVFGLHLTTHLPPGHVAMGPGAMWAAAELFEIELTGQGAHGAYPHMGRSPLLAAAHLAVALQSLVSQEVAAAETAVLSLGYLKAGERPNIIPDRALLGGSLRTLSETVRHTLKTRIEQVAQGIAGACRVQASVRFGPGCMPVHNEPRHTELARHCARAVLGPSAVHDSEPSLASDDMSVFLEARPGCYFRAGIGPEVGPPPAHHSPEFSMNEAGLLPAARVALRILLSATRPSAGELS